MTNLRDVSLLSQQYTHIYGVKLLEPIVFDKGIELMTLFKALPTPYLQGIRDELLLPEYQGNVLFRDMVKYIQKLINNRLDLNEVIQEIKTMSPEFIQHVKIMLRQMVDFEKQK